MVYGLENLSLTKKDISDLKILEGKIIKRALSLTKYASTTAIQQALGLGETDNLIATQKLKFFTRLINNSVTRNILESQLKEIKQIPAKSLLNEVLNILNIRDRERTILEAIRISANIKIDLLELRKKEEENSTRSSNIRYLLKNRTKENEELLLKIVDNFPERVSTRVAGA